MFQVQPILSSSYAFTLNSGEPIYNLNKPSALPKTQAAIQTPTGSGPPAPLSLTPARVAVAPVEVLAELDPVAVVSVLNVVSLPLVIAAVALGKLL